MQRRNGQFEMAQTKNASLRGANFSRILLIKPSALGDVVHTLPVLVKLRARYPRAQIDWLITPENGEIVRCHPALSDVVLFARGDFARGGPRWQAVGAFFDLLKQIRSAKYDLVIDLHGQLRSALFSLISGAQVRIGFDRPIKPAPTVSAEHDLRNIASHGWPGRLMDSLHAPHLHPDARCARNRSLPLGGDDARLGQRPA